MDFSFFIEDHGKYRYVQLRGNISVLSTELFERTINNITSSTNVILGFENIRLITSAGINSIVAVSQRAREANRRVFLMKLNRDHLRLAEMLSLFDTLIIVDSVEESIVKMKYYTG